LLKKNFDGIILLFLHQPPWADFVDKRYQTNIMGGEASRW